jgi:predicted GNAT family acetyltransferase
VARTLSILERYLFYLLFSLSSGKANALVAVDGERIVGCVIPNVTTLAGEKIGSVDVIFVDRNAQGKGVGKALLDSALSRFQEAGCKTVYYVVDRFNSPSWNMVLHRGFDLFEFNEQLRVFGWRIFLLWWVNGYFFNPGTFMLRKTSGESQMTREARAGWHLLLAWIGFSFVLWVTGIRLDAPLLGSIPFVLGVVGVSIFAHELSHKLVARSLGFIASCIFTKTRLYYDT